MRRSGRPGYIFYSSFGTDSRAGVEGGDLGVSGGEDKQEEVSGWQDWEYVTSRTMPMADWEGLRKG